MTFIEISARIAYERTFEGALRTNSVVADRRLSPAARTRTMVAYLKHSLAIVTDGWTIALFSHWFSLPCQLHIPCTAELGNFNKPAARVA